LIYLAAVSVRIIVFIETKYTADDALITFRYAENIAAGKGFVYNPGEKVLGTTAPLLALLLALLIKLKLSCFLGAFVLNSLADLATAFVFFSLFRNQKGPFSWLPAALFLFSPESLQWSLSGMETHLYIAFLFVGFYFAAKESWIAAFVMAALTVLLRVDGIALLGALLVTYLIRYKRLPAVPIAVFVITILPWLIFATIYFGSPLPNSAAAKFALSGETLSAPFQILLRGFLHLNTFGLPILVLGVFGTFFVWRQHREWLPLTVWTWGYAFSYTAAAGPMHPWYYAPFYAGYLAISFCGLVWLSNRYALFNKPALQAVISIVAIIIVLCMSYYRSGKIHAIQAGPNTLNRMVGEWVRANSPRNSTLAVKDIGYIGYYSQRKIMDLAGLVSPECIRFRAKGDFLTPIRKFRPDYFAFSEGQAKNLNLHRNQLMNFYKLAAEMKNKDGVYLIYESVIK
jgi:hypothetical protein